MSIVEKIEYAVKNPYSLSRGFSKFCVLGAETFKLVVQ